MGDDIETDNLLQKDITVCICTYNNHVRLFNCMQRLANQSIEADVYDVIIVDNGTTNSGCRFDICKKFADKHKNFKYIVKQTDGLSGARNECISQSNSKLIHFVDDDVLVNFNFVENTIKCFDRHENLAVLGGRVVPNWSETNRPNWMCDTALHFLSMLDFGDEEKWFGEIDGMWLVGANICFRKSVLIKYGNFSTELGRKGGTRSLMGAEEMNLIYQMKHTEKILYSPHVEVEHIVPVSRSNKNWFIRRVAWQAVSDVMTNTTYLENPGTWSNNKKGYDYIKDNIDSLFSDTSNSVEFCELLKLVKMLSFWLLNDFKK